MGLHILITSQNVDKPKRRQTEWSTNQTIDKSKHRQTETSTNQNVDTPKLKHNSPYILYTSSVPIP